MIWFWTSLGELMDEEQGLMALLIRLKWLCALIKYLGWSWRGRQTDMQAQLHVRHAAAFEKDF